MAHSSYLIDMGKIYRTTCAPDCPDQKDKIRTGSISIGYALLRGLSESSLV